MEIVKKVFKQTSWQLLGKLITSLSTIIILGLVARNYGEEGVGIFTLALTYLTFFNLAADLGLNGFVLSQIDQRFSQLNKLFNFRLFWSIALAVLANLIILIMPFRSSQLQLAILVGSPTIVYSALFNTASLLFQYKLRYDYSTLAFLIESILKFPIYFLLVFLRLQIGLIILSSTISSIFTTIFSISRARQFFYFRLEKIDLSYPLSLIKSSWPVSVTLIINSIYFRVDSFILGSVQPLREVGIYNIAYQFFQTGLVLPTFIMNSYYPIMIDNFSQNKQKFASQLKRAVLGMFFLGCLAAGTTFVFSPIVVPLLTGHFQEGSIISLQILSFSFPAYFLSALGMWLLMLLKKYHSLMVIYLLGLLANFSLNLIFIPRYSFYASSWITGISEYLILLLQLIILWRVFGIKL